MPLYLCMPPVHLYALRGVPPYDPHTPVHLYVLRCFCMLWGVVRGPLTCWTLSLHLPLYGGTSPSVCTPTHSLTSLCISMFWGYWYVIWGFFPSVGGLGQCFPVVGGSGGISTWDAHVLILVHFCSSLCLTFLQWLQVLLLQLWWYLLSCHWFHQ